MEKNEICLSIFINRKNTHIQLSEDFINFKTIDASLGYGKKYFPSIVHFNYSNEEFLFGENAINNDVYEDTYVFNSIIDILSTDDDIIEIGDFSVKKIQILTLFLDEIIEIITNINPNFIIKVISLSYEKFLDKNIDDLFLSAFKKYTSEVLFFEIDEAIYNHAVLKNDIQLKKTNIMYLFNDKIVASSINEISDNYYEDISFSNDIFIEQKIIDLIYSLYMEKFSLDKIEDSEKWEIYKMYFHNCENIINKFFQNKSSKIYFNFCYPPFEETITTDMLKSCIETELDSIKKFVSKIYTRESSIYLYSENNYLDIIISNLFDEFEFIKNNITDSISFCSMNKNYITLKKDDDIKHDIGFFINKNGNKSFFTLIKKGNKNSSTYDTIYFYYIKKHGNKIDIVKKNEEGYIKLSSIFLDEMFTLKELNMISLKVELCENNMLNIKIKNEEDNETKLISICGV